MISKQEPIENIQFEHLTNVLNSFGVNENPYSLISVNDLNLKSLKNLIKKSFDSINGSKPNKQQLNGLDKMWDYLAESDELKEAELIFVFGNSEKKRAEEAVKLWKSNKGKIILFTGHRGSNIKDAEVEQTEADYLATIAMKQGVPKEALILETAAINTPENAIYSVALLEKMRLLPKRIILVTVDYHMRRSYLTFKAVARWNPELIRHSVSPSRFNKQNYYKHIDGWSYVFNEYVKLYSARLMKHF